MNEDRLLALYERIADAPDAVSCLRRFILDLAVRGKLVPQDPKDEPVPELLKRISVEKARLVKTGEIRKFSTPVKADGDEQPFRLPSSWRWVRLGDVVTKLTDGTHHSPPNEPSGEFKYITAKNIKDDGIALADVTYISRKVHDEIYARCNPEKGDILYIKDGATTGIVTINNLDEPFSMLSSVALLKLPSCLFNRLIVMFLRSPFFYDQMRGFMKGAAITRVTLTRMAPALVPLPPLAEQRRIVAKVDELMALSDRLEMARRERERTRDRLAAASFARLNAPDPATFQDDARFVLKALPAITTRLDQIKQLRQTILNLAVRGKLVPQNPNDEPASELLKRIAKEKARLVKAGEARKSEVDPVIEDEASFSIPSKWAWARLGSIADWGAGSTPPRGNLDFYGGGIAWLKSGELNDNRALADSEETVTQLAIDKGSFRINKPGDVLLAMYGATIGKVAILAESAVTNQAVCGCTPFAGVFNQFLFLFLLSQREQFHSASEGGAQPNISKIKIVWTPFPLPPLAEQHRIVVKVDELMALCDRLEVSLASASATHRRLLDALLAEALVPTERERQAAE